MSLAHHHDVVPRRSAQGKKTPNPADIYAGYRVRTQRLVLGMSQSVLADALGITFQQVQKYEKGVNRMGASRLAQIAAVLDVPASHFFADQAKSVAAGDVSENPFIAMASTKDGLLLARAFNRIKDHAKRAIVVRVAEVIAWK
jgi:transcriptional regulator with XRE-family HTH domain